MGAKILVVEDDPDVMRILTHALTAVGHEVTPAYGGDDALRQIKAQDFDLVLTDLAMPEVSGVSVIHAIKQDPSTKHIPVLAVTAHVDDGIAQFAGQAGCDGYVSKPFSAKELVQAVHKRLRPSPA